VSPERVGASGYKRLERLPVIHTTHETCPFSANLFAIRDFPIASCDDNKLHMANARPRGYSNSVQHDKWVGLTKATMNRVGR
jgi:hypothetical protein